MGESQKIGSKGQGCCVYENGHKKVGATGFEPATSASRTLRATKLRYTPINYSLILFMEKVKCFMEFFYRVFYGRCFGEGKGIS